MQKLTLIQNTRINVFDTKQGHVYGRISLNEKALRKFYPDYKEGSYSIYVYSNLDKDCLYIAFNDLSNEEIGKELLFQQETSFNVYVNNHGNIFGRMTLKTETVASFIKNFRVKSYSIDIYLEKDLHYLVISRSFD